MNPPTRPESGHLCSGRAVSTATDFTATGKEQGCVRRAGASEAAPEAVRQAVGECLRQAVGGGYCRLPMPLKSALGVRGTVAGHRLGALEGGGGALAQRLGVGLLAAPTGLSPLCPGLES